MNSCKCVVCGKENGPTAWQAEKNNEVSSIKYIKVEVWQKIADPRATDWSATRMPVSDENGECFYYLRHLSYNLSEYRSTRALLANRSARLIIQKITRKHCTKIVKLLRNIESYLSVIFIDGASCIDYLPVLNTMIIKHYYIFNHNYYGPDGSKFMWHLIRFKLIWYFIHDHGVISIYVCNENFFISPWLSWIY